MKPRLIVHIGTPKTGTTSLQHSLYEARGQMRQDCGIYYASTDRSPSLRKHSSVTRAARTPDQLKQTAEFRALMDDFKRSGAHTMIISEEEMATPKESIPEFFERFVPHFEIDIICYLRRQDIFMESLYNQAMRARGYHGIPSLPRFWRDERFFDRMDYHRFLTWWKDIPANVIALDFQREVKSVGLLKSFLAAARIQQVGDLPEKSNNESSDMRLLLALSMISAKRPDPEHQRLMQGMPRAATALESRGMYKPMKTTLGSIERQLILETCVESNELLARDFGVKFSEDRPQEQEHTILEPEAAYLFSILGELSLTNGIEFMRQCRRRVRAGRAEMDSDETTLAQAQVDTTPPEVSDPKAIEELAERYGFTFDNRGERVDVKGGDAPASRLMELLAELSVRDGLRLLDTCRAHLLAELERLPLPAPKKQSKAPTAMPVPRREAKQAAPMRAPALSGA